MLRRKEVYEKLDVIALAQVIVQRQSGLLTDKEALAAPTAFEVWGAGMKYGEGQIIQHKEQLYRVMQAIASSEAHRPPDGAGMLAVYRPIEAGHDGTKDDPIPYTYGMDCRNGLYYSYQSKLWLCKADMIPCTWPPGSAGMWQWEKVS